MSSSPRYTFYKVEADGTVSRLRRTTCPPGYTQVGPIPPAYRPVADLVNSAAMPPIHNAIQVIPITTITPVSTNIPLPIISVPTSTIISSTPSTLPQFDDPEAEDKEEEDLPTIARPLPKSVNIHKPISEPTVHKTISEDVHYELKQKWAGANERINTLQARNVQLEDGIRDLLSRNGKLVVDLDTLEKYISTVLGAANMVIQKVESAIRTCEVGIHPVFQQELQAALAEPKKKLANADKDGTIAALRDKHRIMLANQFTRGS